MLPLLLNNKLIKQLNENIVARVWIVEGFTRKIGTLVLTQY